jgi:hypothetical protein
MGAEWPKLSQCRNRSHEEREPPSVRATQRGSSEHVIYSIVYGLSEFCLSKGVESYNRKSREDP